MPDRLPEHPDVRHEPTDVSLPGVIVVLLVALVLGVVIHVVLWFHLKKERSRLDAERASPFPLAAAPAAAPPPAPRLEQIDRLSGRVAEPGRAALNAQLDALKRYGPTAEAGYIHVPIDRAMDHLANRLPARQVDPGAGRRANGLLDHGEPNSGRLLRKEAKWSAR